MFVFASSASTSNEPVCPRAAPSHLARCRSRSPPRTAAFSPPTRCADRISIKGVNWFGAEGQNAAPDGLWERSAAEYLDFAVEHGFNALRLPLAVNHVLSDPPVDRWFTREWAPADEHGEYPSPPLRSLEVVERVVAMAASRGLLVMLDVHRLNASVWPDPRGLWYDAENARPSARLDTVAAAWARLAARFCGHWNAFAADLFNEPWGGTWSDEEWDDESGDWPAAARCAYALATRAGACPRASSSRASATRRRIASSASGARISRGCNARPTRCNCPPSASCTRRTSTARAPHPEMWLQPNRLQQLLDAVWREHGSHRRRDARRRRVGRRVRGRRRRVAGDVQALLLGAPPPRRRHHSTSTSLLHLQVAQSQLGRHERSARRLAPPHAARLALLRLPRRVGVPPASRSPAAPRAFRCGKGEAAGALCVHAEQVCNGVDECRDRTDEGKKACKAAGRAQPCVTIGGQHAAMLEHALRRTSASIHHPRALDDAIDGSRAPPLDLLGGAASETEGAHSVRQRVLAGTVVITRLPTRASWSRSPSEQAHHPRAVPGSVL